LDATELKEYISSDNTRIIKILESLNCHSIKEYHKEYRCGLPNDDDNKTKVLVKKHSLSSRIYDGENGIIKGDIFTLVMNINNLTFIEALKHIKNIFNIKHHYQNKNVSKPKYNPLSIFEKVARRKCNVDDLPTYNDAILDEYSPYPHIDWIREGIMPYTCKEFNIGYSYRHSRIIIPHRHWCGDRNTYVGIMGRTTIQEYEMLDIAKYLAIKPYSKTLNIYGLNENYQHIQQAGEVYVFEAEKSVLKRHSHFDRTAVAICSHDMSDEQVKILIGLDVDIIICYDEGVSLEHIRRECEKFKGVRNVYYIFDKWKVLKHKESPADRLNKQYQILKKYKIKYGSNEDLQLIKQYKKGGI